MQTRENAHIVDAQPENFTRSKADALSPPSAILPNESASLNTVRFDYEKDVTAPPQGQIELYQVQANKAENK